MEERMLNRGKSNILGILIDAVDYESAVDFVFRAAREHRSGHGAERSASNA